MSLRQSRAFLLYQAARLFMVIAIQAMAVVIGWQVYERTHDPLALGMVGLAQFLPLLFASPIAGEVVDRVDRRGVLAACHFVILGVALGLAWASEHPEAGATPIFALLVVFGVARGFSGPAGQALLPALVPKGELARGIAWGSTTFQIGVIVGPAVGGIVFAATSGTVVYVMAACLEALAVALLLGIRYRPEPLDRTARGFRSLLAGVRFVRERRVLLGAISLDLFAVLLGGATALLPIYARDILHVGEWGLGLLRSAPALGAGVVAIGLAFRPLERRAGAITLGCVALYGVATIVFGLSTSFPLSVLALAILGAADMVSVVLRQTIVQLETPPEMRGRVAAVNMIFIGASNELGELESGVTAAWLGTVRAVVLGGVGAVLVPALWARLFPELRRVDRME